MYFQRLSVSDRTHLLEDAFSLAQASELEYSIAMNMTGYLRLEKSSVPWSIAATKLAWIDKLLSFTDAASKYRVKTRNSLLRKCFDLHEK